MMMRACAIAIAVAAAACSSDKGTDPTVGEGRLLFKDDFERESLGSSWLDTSKGRYSIVDGRLRAAGAHNHPLWLRRELPRDARVEFVASSASPAIDIKCELFGDGRSHAREASYVATSYVVILGGWNNTRSIVARMDEHGDGRVSREDPRGEPGREYRFSIARKGGKLVWKLDGEEFLTLEDDEPLAGAGHEHFAFNNWESEVYFDDLAVYGI